MSDALRLDSPEQSLDSVLKARRKDGIRTSSPRVQCFLEACASWELKSLRSGGGPFPACNAGGCDCTGVAGKDPEAGGAVAEVRLRW